MKSNIFDYDNLNKLHLMLGGEIYALHKAREIFMKDLKKAQKIEKEYCARHKIEPNMTAETFNRVADLVDKSTSFFQIEALARFIFDDLQLPTFTEVKSRALALEKILPIFKTLKATRNPLRSF